MVVLKKNITDRIIEFLILKPNTAKEIHTHLDSSIFKVSIQAIYDQLRLLIGSGVLIKSNKEYHVSLEWIEKVSTLFNITNMPELMPGEKIRYTFSNLAQLDAFWKHGLRSYGKENPHYPMCIYNQHDFWTYIDTRDESEQNFYDMFEKQKRYGYFLIGGETKLDKLFKKRHANEYFKINCIDKQAIDFNLHLLVLENIVITTRISQGLSEEIDGLYRSDISEKEISKQINTLTTKTKTKRYIVTIEHNKKKANRYRKLILRDFHIPEELRDLYNF